MQDLVSVIVPVYRVEQYIKRCVESIIHQTYKNLEIILVDDGSDDLCPAICDDFSAQDKRIIVIHKQNGGLSSARNAGIEIATGVYVAFVDSDDCISANYILILLQLIKKYHADIAQCDYLSFTDCQTLIFEENNSNEILYDSLEMLQNIYCNGKNICSTVAWTKLYARRLFASIRYPNGKIHEDEFTTYKLFDLAENGIIYTSQKLYAYYENSDSITRKRLNINRLDSLSALLERYQYFNEKRYFSLRKMTAENFIKLYHYFSNHFSEVKDIKIFEKRMIDIWRFFQQTVLKEDLNVENRLLMMMVHSPHQFIFCFRLLIYIKAILKKIKLSRVKKYLLSYKIQKKYRKELESLFQKKKISSRIFIIGSIEYDNLGDHAIIYAQKIFLRECFKNLDIIEIRDDLYLHERNYLKKLIKTDDLITIPGGGNMGNIWFDDERRRRCIIQDFPNNTIVSFPQSIFYDNSVNGSLELENSKKIYRRHHQLVLCAREYNSFEKLQYYYPENIILLVPDIVFSLGKMSYIKQNHISICFRNDQECDLNQFVITDICKYLTEHKQEFHWISTIHHSNVLITERDNLLGDLFMKVGTSKFCITDRLHCMIICAITQTPCLVFDNSNKKISATYNSWLKDCTFIRLVNKDDYRRHIDDFLSSSLIFSKFELKKQFNDFREFLINACSKKVN